MIWNDVNYFLNNNLNPEIGGLSMRIGMIAGNFDIIHMGYIYMFNECADNCDHLICFLHDDPSIERKEKLKPIHTLEERKKLLSSFNQIQEIVTYKTESDLYELIKNRKIDIRFLGDDYKNKDFTGKTLIFRSIILIDPMDGVRLNLKNSSLKLLIKLS